VGEYTMKRVSEVHGEWWRNKRKDDRLPFASLAQIDDVQVIINNHRYKLS
jgi:hypothetical protein